MTKEKNDSKSLSPLIELESLFYNYPVPSLISLYRGRPGIRKEVLNSLSKKLEKEGFLTVDFNARKHFSNQDLSGALLEDLLINLKKAIFSTNFADCGVKTVFCSSILMLHPYFSEVKIEF